MVTLYGPDTLNMLRSAPDSLTLSSTTSPSIKKSKKWVKNQFLEVIKKNEFGEDLSLSSHILSWLKSLPASERSMVVSHEAPLICTFIWQMFIKKLSDGEVDFSLVETSLKSFDPDNFDHNFKAVKKSAKAQSISNTDFQTEKSFERSIRLTDSEEYLDTLTLDSDLLNDPDKLIEYMKTLSQGKAFKVPCYAFWDNNAKTWLWDYPPWFTPSRYTSLAAWACASIEKSIWMNYWEMNGLDPVSCKSTSKNFSFKEKTSLVKSWQLMESLVGFFAGLKTKEKEKVVGSIDEIDQDYITARGHLMNFTTKCVNYATMPRSATFYPSSHLCFPFYPHPLTSFYSYTEKANIKFYQSHESVSSILQRLTNNSDRKFIEFLMSSPLERAVTLLDIVNRKVLYRIMNAYTEKNALELIQIESSTNKAPLAKLQKKPKKHKNRNKKQKNKKNLVQAEKITDEERSGIAEFVKIIINKLIDEAERIKDAHDKLKKESLEKTTEFQEVLSQKQKHRKQPQQKSKSSPKKNFKHCRKNFRPQLDNCKGQTNSLQLTQKSSEVSTSSSELKNPLSPLDSLHRDIVRLGEQTHLKLQDKIMKINKVLEKLSEIVAIAFEVARIELYGSYASGLAIEASDVDIVVSGLEFSERRDLEMACDYLAAVICNYPFISKLKSIHTARIPVIKLEINTQTICGSESILNFDITFDDSCAGNSGSHLGLSTLYLTKELQRLYPSLQFLVLVLKKFLYQQGLNSAYKGGLSSYSLVLWVAALLNSMSVVPENLGELLVEFFKFYGTEFDPSRTGVNIMNGGSFFELETPGFEAVVTIDPVNQLNNTRMSYQIAEVLKAFKGAFEIIREYMEKGRSKKILKNILKKKALGLDQ